MLDKYRPQDFRAVASFARKLENFFYVRLIIRNCGSRAHRGDGWVWREHGRIVAFSAVSYLNKDDAWLWGMRVDPAFHGRGVATRFTQALFPVIKSAGRTWAGLNTLDHRGPKATFRVMEKLGMRLEDVQCDDVYWRRPKKVGRPRLQHYPGILDHFRKLGRKTVFYEKNGWLNCRLLPARAGWLDRYGRRLDGTPVALIPHTSTSVSGTRHRVLTVDVFDRPEDFRTFVPRLLALMPKRGNMVVNYPVEWRHQFRAAARAAIPGLKRNRGYWPSAWRIYGKTLTR
jgi:RimJ/RimL family protein N-acetyltransferase